MGFSFLGFPKIGSCSKHKIQIHPFALCMQTKPTSKIDDE
jgi:hypothetical protein